MFICSKLDGSTANSLSMSSSRGCMQPLITRECRGPPMSTEHICCRVPDAICWSEAPTRASPTQMVFSVRAANTGEKRGNPS
ncbi:hypothetical protein FKM82_028134 [Ascaphus truei]